MLLIAIFITLIFVYSSFSKQLERTILTAPILFTAAGMMVFSFLPEIPTREQGAGVFLRVAEVGLVLLLFTDASRTELWVLRRIENLPLRLLTAGMLLTIALGAAAALAIFGQISIWEAGILAAILAPTDAGLGQIIVNSEQVPMRIRQALNVEAGLNDGLSVPFMLFFFALASSGGSSEHAQLTQFVGEQLGLGVVVGVCIGLAGGWWLGLAARQGWMAESLQQLGVVALPILCLLAAEAVAASMFIAAFVAGLMVQVKFKEAGRHSVEFAEQWGQLINLSVFFMFGMLIARLATVPVDAPVVCNHEPDRGAHVAGSPLTDWDAFEQVHDSVHGLVRAARACLHRAGTRLPRTGNPSARRRHHPPCRHGDCSVEHFCARIERPAGHPALRQKNRRSAGGCAGTSADLKPTKRKHQN